MSNLEQLKNYLTKYKQKKLCTYGPFQNCIQNLYAMRRPLQCCTVCNNSTNVSYAYIKIFSCNEVVLHLHLRNTIKRCVVDFFRQVNFDLH